MPLPALTANGDLPPGVHAATLAEILARFGSGTPERVATGRRLAAIHRLALSTEKVRRFVVFGSFVTNKPAPDDVDLFLVMEDDFAVAGVAGEATAVFDHTLAAEHFGASIFWVRALAALGGEQAAVEYWQVTRGGGQRGIVEIVEPSA
ncbi:MAG: hypothetical protein FJ309_07305 [Planctomycetes bacterium]|nr:hypothetical protein [Planctomycetota bacterium]